MECVTAPSLTGDRIRIDGHLQRPAPRSVTVPMRGLLIVNDVPPPMAPEWHPESDDFCLVEAALSR